MKRVAVLGSTGSIGKNCLEVIGSQSEQMELLGISAHRSWELLGEQSQAFHPRYAVLSHAALEQEIPTDSFCRETQLLFGPDSIETIAREPDVDVVVSAIVGAAGLQGTWAAVETGKTVAIANKETLVVAGPLMMDLARKSGATLLPVDSEHSAVFQAMHSGKAAEVKRIVLTASGGPFRGYTAERLKSVTREEALAHPTWEMGPKITIDSATMMNKALEVIEAKWLFGLDVSQIEVIVHPQSIVHSFVEFVDGSVIAQLSPPDMKLPIQYALTFPERTPGLSPKVDWTQTMTLDFEPPDREAFPALDLGFEVAEKGGTCGAVLNAANEAAVERFLSGDFAFHQIPRACREILEHHDFDALPALSRLWELDRWAREEITRWKP